MKEKEHYIFACITEWPMREPEKSRWVKRVIRTKENGLLDTVFDLPEEFSLEEVERIEQIAKRQEYK